MYVGKKSRVCRVVGVSGGERQGETDQHDAAEMAGNDGEPIEALEIRVVTITTSIHRTGFNVLSEANGENRGFL